MNRPAPIVPLSKPAWERVEARLLERLARGEHLWVASQRKRSRPWLHMIPALTVAAAVALWWQRAPSVPVPGSSSHLALVPPLPSAAPAPREAAHFVTTDAPARTTLAVATITLAAQSEMSIVESGDAGWRVNVARGHVDFDVAHREGRAPFVVQAGETLVTVVGTRFSVLRDGPGARVSVARGRVQVDSGPHRVSLAAGEQWPNAPPIVSPEALPQLAKSPKSTPGRARRERARHPSVHAHRAKRSFDRATRMESRNARAAIAIYRQLARSKGPWAANALYAESRLELERGRPVVARRRLERYLRSYPDGENASDVRSILGRLGSVPGSPARSEPAWKAR